jgi:hypothetical protein
LCGVHWTHIYFEVLSLCFTARKQELTKICFHNDTAAKGCSAFCPFQKPIELPCAFVHLNSRKDAQIKIRIPWAGYELQYDAHCWGWSEQPATGTYT